MFWLSTCFRLFQAGLKGRTHPFRDMFLGVDSPFISAIVLFKNQPFPQGSWWFSRKKEGSLERMEMEATPMFFLGGVHGNLRSSPRHAIDLRTTGGWTRPARSSCRDSDPDPRRAGLTPGRAENFIRPISGFFCWETFESFLLVVVQWLKTKST